MEATDERTSRGTHVPFSPRKMFLNKERLDGPHIWLEGEHVSKAWLPDLFNPESLLSVDKENYLSWLL